MTLVDTSIWMDHFKRPDAWLLRLLADGSVLGHAFVTGEIACGRVPNRSDSLRLLHELPQARITEPDEVLAFVGRHGLAGAG
ncbi:MAG: type II toxin-antitoxin system VapC family toxin, partial [Acetobacteraceae bacterium]|nr:type II toxin-antitoxin system VapC family toxin [Acetobacteraceae bacterium]